MMARRRPSSIPPHAAISTSVRPQPTHSPVLPSTMHTLVQGVEMEAGGFTALEDAEIGGLRKSRQKTSKNDKNALTVDK